MLSYTVATTNATNKVTATPTDESAEVEILLNGDELQNGTSATWEVGENELVITVTDGSDETVYTVAVTKS